jgi:hypothetical protein
MVDQLIRGISGWPAEDRRAIALALVYKIAIGRYPGFIHIDTRGTNASWGTASW